VRVFKLKRNTKEPENFDSRRVLRPHEEIKSEIIALNLKGLDAPEMKVVYIFLSKRDCSITNCVLKVNSNVRSRLLSDGFVCIGYSTCRVTDYISVLQCFRCLAFGHLARNCKFSSLCGYCAGEHETKICTKRDTAPLATVGGGLLRICRIIRS